MPSGLEIGRLIGYVELDDSGVEQGAQSVKDRLGELAGSGAGLGKVAGLAAGAALAAGIAGAMELEPAQAKLTAQLDLSADEAKRIGGVAGELYSNAYGDSLDDVNEAIRGVIQNIDGMADAADVDLERIAGKVLAVSSTFDQDLGGVTRAIGTMMRNGLATDADQALDVLTRGFQNGTNVADDLLDTFSEYSTQFRQLGLDGPAAMGLLSQGLKGGARDADTVADALKELAIRSVDGSETTIGGYEALGLSASQMAQQFAAGGKVSANALDTVLDRLRDTPDPILRSQAAVALFGTKAEDLAQALYDLDPTTAVEGLGKVEGAAQRVADTTGGTATAKFEAFTRTLKTFATGTLAETVLPLLSSLGGTLVTVVQPPLEVVADVLGLLADGFDALPGPIQTTTLTLAALVAFRGPLSSMWGGTKKAADAALGAITNRALATASAIGAQGGGLSGAIGAASAAGSTAARGGLAALSGAMGGPLGIAVAGLSIGVPLLTSLFSDNEDQAGDTAAANSTLADAIRNAGGAIDETVRKAAAKELDDEGLLDVAKGWGVAASDMLDASLGQAEALERVRDAARGNIDALEAQRDAIKGSDLNAETQRAVIDGLIGANEKWLGSVEGKNKATAGAVATERELDAAISGTTVEAEDQAAALEKLTGLFDKITGRSQSLAESQLTVADGIADFAERAKDAGTSLDRNTQKGRDNERAILGQIGAIEDLSNATLDATGSSDLARQAYEREVGALRGRLVELGYNNDEVDELLARYADIPAEAWTEIGQPGMPAAQQAADVLRDKVLDIPDGKTIHTKALSGEAVATLEALGYKVEHLPDGTVNVHADGGTTEADIAYLARAREVELRLRPVGNGLRGLHVSAGGTILEHDGGLVRFAGGGTWQDAARGQGLTPATTGVAAVAGPDTWRVFGDRADVDEFYLPDNDDPRSLALGDEWLRRRGLAAVPLARYAAGGTFAGASTSSAPTATTATTDRHRDAPGVLFTGPVTLQDTRAAQELADELEWRRRSRGRRR